MATLINDLFDLPDVVRGGDFVLRLVEGLERPEQTLRDYVVWAKRTAAFAERRLRPFPRGERIARGQARAGVRPRARCPATTGGSGRRQPVLRECGTAPPDFEDRRAEAARSRAVAGVAGRTAASGTVSALA